MTHQKRAFTLVELLVVVAIIAIIMSLLLPALRNARLSAQGGACLSNLHQVALAGVSYTMEHKGFLPPAGADSVGGSWPAIKILHTGLNPSAPLASPDHYAKFYLITLWGKGGDYEGVPRGGDGYFGPYLNSNTSLDPTNINMNTGAIDDLRILGCPSVAAEPYPLQVTYFGGVYTNFVEREASYGYNWGAGGSGGMVDGWNGPGRRVQDLPGRLVMMADGTGDIPYLLWPGGAPHEQNTARTPTPRHVNHFNAAFVGGHAKGGTIENLWTEEFFLDFD